MDQWIAGSMDGSMDQWMDRLRVWLCVLQYYLHFYTMNVCTSLLESH